MEMKSRKARLFGRDSSSSKNSETTNYNLKDINMHGGTHICGVSEDDALAVVVTDGFGCHGDRDERPVDF